MVLWKHTFSTRVAGPTFRESVFAFSLDDRNLQTSRNNKLQRDDIDSTRQDTPLLKNQSRLFSFQFRERRSEYFTSVWSSFLTRLPKCDIPTFVSFSARPSGILQNRFQPTLSILSEHRLTKTNVKGYFILWITCKAK